MAEAVASFLGGLIGAFAGSYLTLKFLLKSSKEEKTIIVKESPNTAKRGKVLRDWEYRGPSKLD